jgi:serine/threonine protein kinase/Flp pilus assembly protein TadD
MNPLTPDAGSARPSDHLPNSSRRETASAPEPIADANSPAAAASELGDYRILREVGRGGMGVVYEALQESLGRHVALKVLRSSALADATQVDRFQREARAAARLHHTNIVPVYGVGEQNGLHYYVMQFIAGVGLDRVLDDLRAAHPLRGSLSPSPEGATTLTAGRVSASEPEAKETVRSDPTAPVTGFSSSGREYWRWVARLGLQVAEALVHAHAQGILHRDIKPSNLLLDAQGNVWVTDFGLAKAADSADLTGTGEIVGTLRYIPPERFRGQSDPRGDIYALGLTLYELLTLRPAFDAEEHHRLLESILHDEPPAPRKLQPAVPRDLETIVLKAAARDPAHRYTTASELAADLQRFLEDRPPRARRAGPVERLRRWCRRNPVVAGLTAALLLFLVAAGVIASVAALRFRDLAVAEAGARSEADQKAAEIEEGLEKFNRANTLVESGRRHEVQGNLAAAHADYTRATEERPDNYQVWAARGRFLLRLGLLDEAAEDFARVFALRKPSDPVLWFFHACLRVYAGDTAGYRKVCGEMIEHFGGSAEPELAGWLASACLVGPDAGVDAERLLRLAEAAAPTGDAKMRTPFLLTRLAFYRTGQFSRAAAEGNAPDSVRGGGSFETGVASLAAMTAQRLRQVERAREKLRLATNQLDIAATTLARQSLGTEPEEAKFLGLFNEVVGDDQAGWLACYLLFREATALIERTPADHPLPWMLRGRTCAVLGRWDDALTAATHAMSLQPQNAWLVLERARLNTLRKQPAEAEKDLTRVESLTGNIPEGRPLRLAVCELYLDQENWDRAEAGLRPIQQAGTRGSVDQATLLLARVLAARRQWDEAGAMYTLALQQQNTSKGFGPPGAASRPARRNTLPRSLRLPNRRTGTLVEEIVWQDEIFVRVAPTPQGGSLWFTRIRWLAERGDWDRAAAAYFEAISPRKLPNEPGTVIPSQDALIAEVICREELFRRIAERSPDDARLWLARARWRLQTDSGEQAAPDFLRALAANPPSTPPNFRHDLYQTIVQDDEVFKRVAQGRPDDGQLWMQRGCFHLGTKDNDTADADFAQAERLRPGDVGLLKEQAIAYGNAGRFDRAVLVYGKALKLAPADVELWKARAAAHGRLEQWGLAADDLTEALARVPAGPNETWTRDSIYDTIARTKPLFDTMTQRRPRDAQLWVAVGRQVSQNKPVEAVQAFKRAAEIEPKDPAIWQQLGRAHALVKEWDAATSAYLRALDLVPERPLFCPEGHPIYNQIASWDPVFEKVEERRASDPRLWLERARATGASRRYPLMAVAIDKLIELAPKEPLAWVQRSWHHEFLRLWDKAVADRLKAMDLLPAVPPYTSEHNTVYGAGITNSSREMLDRLVKARPKDPWVWDGRARNLAQSFGNLPAAESDYAQAFQLRPNDPVLLCSRGRTYSWYGLWDRAAEDFLAARKAQDFGDDTSVWYEAAVYLAAARKTEECHTLCRDMRERFASTNVPLTAHHLAAVCLLLPDGPAEPKKVLALAELAHAADPKSPRNILILALAHHRAGDSERALTLLKDYLQTADNRQHELIYTTWLALVQGLAEAHLGQSAAARTRLTNALAGLDARYPADRKVQQPQQPAPDLAFAVALRREAEGVLKALPK